MRAPSTPKRHLGWTLFGTCLALTLLKIWLIHSNDVPARNLPHDDLWYVHAADHWYWRAPYEKSEFETPPFIRRPAYPIFIALANLTGLRLRLAIEMCLGASALAFVAALVAIGQPRVLAGVLFALLVFQPATLEVNNRVGTDSLYGPVLILAVACGLLQFHARRVPARDWWAFGTGAALAVLWHVRQESVLIWAYLAVLAIVHALGNRDRFSSVAIRRALAAAVIPGTVIAAASFTTKSVNLSRFGVFSADAMSTSGFRAAANALLRVRPDHSIRYVPVTRDVLRRVYAVSPALAELQQYFDGESGRTWAGFAASVGVSAPGEIAASHFWWAMNDAVYVAGYKKSAREADQFYARVAAEIDAACAYGRLACRMVPLTGLEPNILLQLRQLPASFIRAWRLQLRNINVDPEADDADDRVKMMFDRITHRRATASTIDHRAGAVQHVLATAPGALTIALVGAATIALIVLVVCRRAAAVVELPGGPLAILAATVAVRVVGFVILDTSTLPLELRYLYPVLGLFDCLLVIIVATGARVLKVQLR